MAEATIAAADRPAWIDLSTSDQPASQEFYARVFGWTYEVSPDPQYGGYAIARTGDQDVAGIGVAQSPDQPTAWSVYIGTPDADDLCRRVAAAGGTVIASAFDVGDAGRMAVFQDPAGAFISGWQPRTMEGFGTAVANTFGWAELNARGIDAAIPFYRTVFGWTQRTTPMPDSPPYTEFLLDGASVAGGMEMSPMVPAEVPSYWMVYFAVADVDASFAAVLAAGGREMLAPTDFAGGRFAVVGDPQGAAFGLMKMA